MNGYERAYAEVKLDALKHNITEAMKIISEVTRFIAIVKADAYGHGAVPVTRAAKECGVNMFGVAIIDEAIELRKSGVDDDIIILGACFKQRIEDFINYNCEQTVFTVEMAREIQSIAEKLGKTAKIHLKIDTGMGRVGFLPSPNTTEEITEILKMKNVEVKGIFSHFACSDHKDKSYSAMQHERFLSVISSIKEKGLKIPPLHISNSGAIIDLPSMNYDAVRAGIMLYGIYPSQDVNKGAIALRPVMSIKASISFVKTIKQGECVSYNSRFKAEKDTVVATIPFGYADGCRRLLGNKKGRVLVHGRYAPIIGDICMDQFMVDVTGIDGVQIGDEAVIMGKQGENEITADEIAQVCGTIPYEVVCDITKRVPRVYL